VVVGLFDLLPLCDANVRVHDDDKKEFGMRHRDDRRSFSENVLDSIVALVVVVMVIRRNETPERNLIISPNLINQFNHSEN